MAEVEQLLVAKLVGTAGVSSLVGSRVSTVVLPQGETVPAIVCQRIAGPRLWTQSTTTLACENPTFQVTCLATTHKAARELARAVMTALGGWTDGANGIQGSLVRASRDLFDPGAELFRVIVEVEIWHTES